MKIQIADHRDESNKSSLLHRGQLFGDGFFTTGLIENHQLLHCHLHLARLIDSAKRLKFDFFEVSELQIQLDLLCESVAQAIFRISVERVQATRGYAIDPLHEIQITIILSPWQACTDHDISTFIAQTPVSVNSYLAGIKHLNRLDNVLAASECKTANEEALMFNQQKLICGSRSNVFLYIDNQWMTPKLDHAGVAGITRQRVLALFKQYNISCREVDIEETQLVKVSAGFLTNSLMGIRPIGILGDKALDTDLVRDLQSKLHFFR